MTAAALLAAAAICHAVAGAYIQGSDLAAASPAFRELPAGTDIGYAPLPGAKRHFDAAALARLARAHRLPEEGIEPVCFERKMAPLDADRIVAAMRAALDDGEARVEIVAISRFPAPEGEIVFPRGWLARPAAAATPAVWNGYVQYDGGRFPIWARVLIPREVEKGEAIAVEVRSGAARLKFEARAETPGRRGDDVRVRNIESGKLFSARVAGKGFVVVEAQ